MNTFSRKIKSSCPKQSMIIVNHKTNYQIEYRIRRTNGEIRTLAQQGVAVFDEYNILDRIIGTVNDITPQKKAEQALRESEAYARLLFDPRQTRFL